MAPDARSVTRFRLSAPAVFQWVDSQAAQKKGEGITRDISGAGIFLWSEQCPPCGSEVVCEVFLPRLKPGTKGIQMKSRGRIMRLETPEKGHHRAGFAVALEAAEICYGSRKDN
jgi:hypothetical protein